MKRTVIATLLFSFLLAVPVFAAEGGQPPQGQGQTFEQKKAAILKMLDDRLANIQEDRACVEAAKNDDDLKACREKGKARLEKQREGRRSIGGQGGPGQGAPASPGKGGPGGQGRQAPPPPQQGQ
jgi:hypothetical protein